ncbi:hypothetical protein F3Y22_tig00111238pilonHSYRG00195 [Hibiscus syriacus]|uniref:Uncharacterized protein n=1 Tax=Hibiscus syriacus TaxID=106335 RepID=A0A6A2YT57_HIBSY|nr:rho GTPase-activating protein gacZ-like [Hibiscus syriacus]KAE8682553.1 hypothetical protein F3Y22_tig00111238pilonHSYRG00195 [Hibiscus syriacus]
MAASEKELELQLMEAGNRLVEPPSSVDELIPLLDQVESFLSRVEQSPSQSMQNALSPSLKALVAEHLFRHPDDDVKVAVAACISEITRITAPDAPYEDDQMREVFQLIVSSFENLSDKSSRSFIKRTSILETVAKVRSCVVMLDLECDDLIVEMFQHFLKAIRDYHPEAVFTSMVTIMSLVLEESEDIPMKLLSPILTSVKKDNEEVLPVAQSLAEKVLENCASKLQPYLTQAVENMGISYDDYSSVLASVCRATAGVVEQNDAATGRHVDDESILVEAPSEKAAQENKQIPEEAVKTEQVDLANEKSPKTVFCNGTMQTAEEDSLADSNSVKKKEGDRIANKSKKDNSTVAEPDISKAEEVVNSDPKLEQSTQEKERESDLKLNELSDSSHVDEKAVEALKDHKNDSKDDAGSRREVVSVDGFVSSENRRETDVPHSSQKATEEESTDVPHSSQKATEKESTDVPHSSQKATEEELTNVPHSTRAPRSKRKESVSKETVSSFVDVSKKAHETTSDSEAKTNRRGRKKVATVVSNENNAPVGVDETKKESDTANDSEAKSLKNSSKKVDSNSNNADETKKESDTVSDSEAKSLKKSSKKVDLSGDKADESTSRQLTDSKRRARGKVVPEKDRTKTSTKNDEEEVVGSPKSPKPNKQDSHMEETPKANSKRKLTPSKEKASDSMEYGENLVGLKVKVWWPADREFYVGFIHSFDPSKKKHKVNYIDGDQEILNLKREKWAVIEDESGSDEEGADNHPSPDGSSDMPQGKKAKTSDLLSKKAKTDASPKRGGGTSTGKSKGAAMKSSRKTKDEAKMDGKSIDGSKSATKSDNDGVAKSKDHTPKTGIKSVDIASKVSNKSKNENSGDTPKSTKSKDDGSATPKASAKLKQDALKTAKSKQETPKVSPLSKSKPLKSGGKSNANGTVKSKSDASKLKESESTKDNSSDSAKVVGSAKRKASSLSKARGSDSKSGKKRRR